MGANPTQAQAVLLLIVAFTLMCVGLAGVMPFLFIVLGLICLGLSIMLFRKAKPWEHEAG